MIYMILYIIYIYNVLVELYWENKKNLLLLNFILNILVFVILIEYIIILLYIKKFLFYHNLYEYR